MTKAWETLGAQIKTIAKEDPSQGKLRCPLCQLGALAPRLTSVVTTTQLLLEHGEQPRPKWVEVDSASGFHRDCPCPALDCAGRPATPIPCGARCVV